MDNNINLEFAIDSDAQAISELINLAYRGDEGWTTEKGIVVGERCTENDIRTNISSNNSVFLLYKSASVIQACISIQIEGSQAYIGSFAVTPMQQNTGLGKVMLKGAEEYSLSNFSIKKFVMVVLSNRIELIKFYERRGYQRTGNIRAYPKGLNVGVPIDPCLTIEDLVKTT